MYANSATDSPSTIGDARTDTAPSITETVSFRRPASGASDVGKDASTWSWENLRDYVVRSIEKTHGPFPRDAIKEKSIFSSFVSRWGAQAGPIAQFAFGACEGMWKGSPVRVNRFCKGSDQYFAAPIVERLTGVQ